LEIHRSIINQVIDLAEKIQQVQAPTFHEQQRAEFFLSTLRDHGAQHAWKDQCGNVNIRLPGRSKKPMVVVSAHLDTVFPQVSTLSIRRSGTRIYGTGIGDNSLGLAALFGLFLLFNKDGADSHRLSQPEGDLLLVANVGEEGLGDLQGMKAVVDQLGHDPAAYIILEGMLIGHIYHRGLGVKRYRLTVQTPGGHSWIDYGRPSAIHILAELIMQITRMDVPMEPRSSFNVGVISGGTSVNTIAAQASCELDLRSEDSTTLRLLSASVESLIEEENRSGGQEVKVKAEVIGERPSGELRVDHPLVTRALQCYARYGIKPSLNIGSTDANVPLSRGLPAICIGLTTGGGAHTQDEYIDIGPVGMGLGIVADLIQAVFKDNSRTS
jgi:acetylornithine deacetylase/succinyl-diaminopimelate desuccinylase-like protein